MPVFQQGLRRQEGMYKISATEGLDSLRKDLDIGAKADIAQNLRFSTEVGSVTKRPPVSFFNITKEVAHPESIYRYYREANNTAYTIGLFGAILKSSQSGTFTQLNAAPNNSIMANSSGRKFTAVTYNDLCILSTGYDNIVQTDGQAAWELGSCKAVVTSSVAGSVPAGTYSYKVGFVTPLGEVKNGAISTYVTTTGATSTITLSYIPQGPLETTSARKLYRSSDNTTWGLVNTGTALDDNVTSTFVDTTAAVTTAYGTTTSDMPRGKYLYIGQERVFVACDVTNVTDAIGRQSTIYYSEQFLPHYIDTQTVDMSTTQAASNYEKIRPDDNDVITGIIDQLGTTWVFKQNSIVPWHIAGTPEVWEVGQIQSIIGCPAPYSIAAAPGGIIYQGWDRMYVFDGQYSTNIIDDFLFEENFLDAERVNNVGFFWNNLYLLAYTDRNTGTSYTNRVLVYDIIRKQSEIDKGGPLINDPATSLSYGNMNVGCFTSYKGSGEWGTLYVGDSQLGFIYQYARTINANQVNTKSAFDLGTHSGTYASPPEENPQLGGVVLDNMEAYTNDGLAQAAWVTDQPATGGTQIPPYLGTGADGVVVISADTTITAVPNYTSFTIDAGKTLTATGLPIYCLGTVTINGTVDCGAIYAHTLVVGAAGKIKYCSTIKANTITNSGSINTDLVADSTWGYTQSGVFDPTYTSTKNGETLVRLNNQQGTGVTTAIWRFPSSVKIGSVSTGAVVSTGSAPGGSGSGASYLEINGAWVSASSGDNVTAFKEEVTATVPTVGIWYTYFNGPLVINQIPDCFYANPASTGVPTSGDITDFVPALQVYSNTDNAFQGSYALQVICMAGLTTPKIAKTLPQAFDLSGGTKLLIDVWSLRTGSNIQIGLGPTSSLTYVTIPVVTANQWATYQVDISGIAPRTAIQYMGINFLDTAAPNIIYVDNIRPSSYAVTPVVYTSNAFNINALSMGSIYWNPELNTDGTIRLYTRTSADGASWSAWSAALTNAAGSAITSAPNIYFQYKVELSTTDITGINFPYIYKADGYNIKFTYWKTMAVAETAVEFIYRTGWRNLDQPFDDKIYRKLILMHDGNASSGIVGAGDDIIPPNSLSVIKVTVECGEQNTQSTADIVPPWAGTSVSLLNNPFRWYTTLPDNMYGKELRLTVYKNDTYEYKLRQYAVMLEMMGLI